MKRNLLIGSSFLSGVSGHRPLHKPNEVPLHPQLEDAHPYLTEDGKILLPDRDVFQRRNLRNKTTKQQTRRHLTSGSFHNLVLLLKFSDHNRPLPPREHYDLLYNSPSTSKLVVPTGSVKTYFHTNSYGQLNMHSTVVGWIELSKSERYYANGDYGFTKIQEAIIEALEYVQSEGYDFKDFDSNGDGVIDGFGMLISGYGAEFAGADCYGADNLNRIWSHKGGVDWTSSNGVSVDRYYVSSGLRNKCDSDIARMGVICHELGHYLGLPDLYDNTFEGSGIGALDVMSQSWGFDGTGVYPPLLSAWSKVSVGWVNPITIDEDGTYELENSETSDKVYRIDSGFPEGEYLLLENRQPDGYDSKIPHGGIAIWHIDENAAQNTRGYPGQESWPENGKHYRIALLPADGNYDLEKGENQGDYHDLWHASSTNTELKAGGSKYPNTDSYQKGLITETGIRIYGFSSSKEKMSFKVEGLVAKKTPTTAPSKLPSVSPSLRPVTTQPSNSPSSTSPTNHPSSYPTSTSPTAHPSASPTSKSPIVTLTATQAPIKLDTRAPMTSNPTSRPNTTSPTSSPISDAERCANRCFEPLPSSECPLNKAYVNCKFSYVGGVCYSQDYECGADPSIGNCNGFAVYKRVNCNEITISSWAAIDAPSNSPTPKPTVLFITGSGSYTSSGGEDGTCKYFPGWASGLSYCINDCDVNVPKPVYMDNNPIYEFPSLDLCCETHFRRSERCKRVSRNAPGLESDSVSADAIGLAFLDGEVWNDSNGDQWRESSDGGIYNAIVDLYECDFNTWVKGTRTSLDGSFHLGRIPPGKYSLKITAPSEFHFIFDPHFWRNEDLNPSIATTPCYELRPFEDNSNFVVGLVPDSIVAHELVSIIDQPESLAMIDQPELSATYSAPHVKDASVNHMPFTASASHSKSSRGSVPERTSAPKPQPVSKEQVQEAPHTTETISIASDTLHSKSFVRDGSTAESGAHEVAVQANEAITISNHSVDKTGTQYLSISKYEDILIKFDVSFLKGRDHISSAVLRLYSLSSSPVGGSVYAASHSIWNGNIVTWQDAPDAGVAINEISSTHPNQWVNVDVTEALVMNTDDFISLRIHMSTTNSNRSAKYAPQKVQLQVTF